MHPAEIQAALKLKGYSQKSIADACGVKPSTVSMVINGRGRSKAIEEMIASTLRLPLGRLWPHWYDDEGAYAQGVREEVGLTDDERMVLVLYRSLTSTKQAQFKSLLKVMLEGVETRDIRASGGSIAAGGNVTIGSKSDKRK